MSNSRRQGAHKLPPYDNERKKARFFAGAAVPVFFVARLLPAVLTPADLQTARQKNNRHRHQPAKTRFFPLVVEGRVVSPPREMGRGTGSESPHRYRSTAPPLPLNGSTATAQRLNRTGSTAPPQRLNG